MSFRQRAWKIESPAFAARLGSASTRRVFIDALNSDPAFTRLCGYLIQHPEAAMKVLRRLRSIAALQVDPRYEHPYDASLAAYAWALNSVRSEAARIASELILRVPQTWWARQLAISVWQRQPSEADSTRTAVMDFDVTQHAGRVAVGRTVLRTIDATASVVPSPLLIAVRRFTLVANPRSAHMVANPASRQARWAGVEPPPAYVVASIRGRDRLRDLDWGQ